MAGKANADDSDYSEDSANEEVVEDNKADETCADDSGDATCADADDPPAAWMSGKWGIAWRNKAGGDGASVKTFNVNKIVKQIQGIPGVGYVLFGLSSGAAGDRYIAPHSVLSELNPRSCPERDLFGELAKAFQEAGYKVLAYMATEGPAKLHHGKRNAYDWDEEAGTAPSVDNWNAYVLDTYGSNDDATLKQAYAEVVVKEFAERYGTNIDGWWFDHASFGNIQLIHDVCTEANPKTIMAFNKGTLGKVGNDNPDYEDYTKGHPMSMRATDGEPASQRNLPMVKAIEASENGFLYKDGHPSLGHMFMPMMEKWNKGNEVKWPEDQAVDWMSRVLKAGGAWTWNVPLADGNRSSLLLDASVDFATRVGSKLQL